jgi:hypothetical protein
MSTLIQSLRRAAADRGVTLIVVGSIAMGITVLTTVFAVASALLLRPLPAKRPHEILRVGLSGRGPIVGPLSPADRELLAAAGPFSGITGH